MVQPLPPPLPHHSHSVPPLHHHVHHPLLQQALVPPALLHDLRASYHRTHLAPLLSLYASDLFSAARHHPQLDAMLLTAKSMNDVGDLARAGRVIGGDLTGIELVRDDAAFAAAAKARSNGKGRHENGNGNGNGFTKAELDTQAESPISPITPGPVTAAGLAHHYQPIEVVVEEVEGESVTTPGRGDAGKPKAQTPKVEVLEVSEADVARIAPRVMTHRLRVRDGPEDEVLASARFSAVEDGGGRSKDVGRITIKEILVRILAEV